MLMSVLLTMGDANMIVSTQWEVLSVNALVGMLYNLMD